MEIDKSSSLHVMNGAVGVGWGVGVGIWGGWVGGGVGGGGGGGWGGGGGGGLLQAFHYKYRHSQTVFHKTDLAPIRIVPHSSES